MNAGGPSAGAQTSAAVFDRLWHTMADVMGSATTATLLRRAARRCAARHPRTLDLDGVVITRDGLEYRFELPPSWRSAESIDAVCALVHELRPLLVELTGQVVLRKLVEIPELVACGLGSSPEET